MKILRDMDTLDYHPTSRKLVEIIQQRCRTSEALYFHNLIAYYFAKVASTMRVGVDTPEGTSPIPVNVYVLNLAISGFGKGKSMNIMEDEVLGLFQTRFLEETYPAIVEESIYKEGVRRAGRMGVDPDEEVEKLRTEFKDTGSYMFSFDSGTTPALKQLRQQLLISRAGSLNFEVDEIGANFSNIQELLSTYLELYDKGKIKNKLVKNTSENRRSSEIFGSTPANLLAFGTPSKLLDSGKTEEEFVQNLVQGYARRCFFGHVRNNRRVQVDPHAALQAMKSSTNSQFLCDISDRLMKLADKVNFNKTILMEDDVAIHWIAYRNYCEDRADELPEHAEILRTDLNHRYWKTMKLAGAYAFIDGDYRITEDHLYYAIKVAEESGKALETVMTQDKPAVKLAKYLAAMGTEVTQYEMTEDLPFYKGSQAARQDMMNLAISWGYKNNVIIKKSYQDGVEFIKGESLKETNLEEMIFSYTDHVTGAYNYQNEVQPFKALSNLTQAQGYHWVNHHVKNGHRTEENCDAGFNMIVLDVDGGTDIATAKLLMKKYTYLLYTTKSHTDADHRYRIVLPINYELKMDAKEFKEFMNAIFEDIPFDVDLSCNTRSKKWLAHAGHCEYNYGELFDALPYIPKTSKNEVRIADSAKLKNLSNVERWFLNTTGEGNRSNNLLRYAMMLVDSGSTYDQVEDHVKMLNEKLADKLSDGELMNTIMKTAARRIIQRDTANAA